jgi:hypothetical protein
MALDVLAKKDLVGDFMFYSGDTKLLDTHSPGFEHGRSRLLVLSRPWRIAVADRATNPAADMVRPVRLTNSFAF